MCAEAFGELGLRPWEFYEYELDEYMLARKGLDNARTWQMRKDRLIASVLLQPYLKKGSKIKPTDLFTLPGEGGSERLMDNIAARNILAEMKKIEGGRAIKDTGNSRRKGRT